MKSKSATFIKEREFIQLVKDNFNVDIESVVANEEIGNHELVINIIDGCLSDDADLERAIKSPMFSTNVFVDHLYKRGVIIDTVVVIDCTW